MRFRRPENPRNFEWNFYEIDEMRKLALRPTFTLIGSVLSGCVGALLLISVAFNFAQGIIGAITFSRFDLTPPRSLAELLNGPALACFLSIPISFFVISFCAIAKKAFNSYADLAIAVLVGTFTAMISGLLLVFLVPTWIALIALLAVTVMAIVGFRGL